jgi:hypothetical protein
MDNREPEQVPEFPSIIGVALDRETLAPETLLIMCGLTRDEIADEVAEFSQEASDRSPSQAELVVEATAFRVAEVLDTLTTQIHDNALQELGKKLILDVAFMVLQQVVIEQRAVIRHENQELDHNCQTESCPLAFIAFEPAHEQAHDLMNNTGITPATRLDVASLWESEWE